jgi:hypothetical protein
MEDPAEESEQFRRVAAPVQPLALIDPAIRDLLLSFESCGDDCEFGLLQRRHGAEPLSALRWAFCRPLILAQLLETEFEGFGDLENIECTVMPWGEIKTREAKYGIGMHTFIRADGIDMAAFRSRESRRLLMLRRKLLEDLELAEKVFVYKAHAGLIPPMLDRLTSAFANYVGAKALFVLPAEGRPNAHIERHNDRVILGYLSEFGSPDSRVNRGWAIPFDEWVTLCKEAKTKFDLGVA